MSDIAQLGISVDSSQVKSGSTDLSALAAAAKGATDAIDALTRTIPKIPKLANDNDVESLRGQRNALRGLTSDLALLSPAFGGVAAAAAGLYIENSHLLENWGGLKSAIGELITPANLLIAGFVGVAAGAAIMLKSVSDSEVALADLGDRTGSTIAQLHGLSSAAAGKGIGAEDFTKGMEKFGDLSTEATHNMGSLAELFRANGVAAGSLADNFGRAADLIKNSRSEAEKYQLIQQLGLPQTHEWVALLSQGSAGLQSATAAATQFGTSADEQLVAKARLADEAWRTTWRNFSDNSKSAFIGMLGFLDQVDEGVTKLLGNVTNVGTNLLKAASNGNFAGTTLTANSDVSALYGRTGAGNGGLGLKSTVDPNVLKNEIALAQPRIGVISPLLTVQEIAAKKPKPTTDKEQDRDDRDCNRKAA